MRVSAMIEFCLVQSVEQSISLIRAINSRPRQLLCLEAAGYDQGKSIVPVMASCVKTVIFSRKIFCSR